MEIDLNHQKFNQSPSFLGKLNFSTILLSSFLKYITVVTDTYLCFIAMTNCLPYAIYSLSLRGNPRRTFIDLEKYVSGPSRTSRKDEGKLPSLTILPYFILVDLGVSTPLS